MKRRILAMAATLAIAACGDSAPSPSVTKAGGDQTGRFKGYVAIDQVLRDRMTTPQGPHLGRYLGVTDGSFSGLATLLGGFIGANGNSQFRNGDPNAMNMLLWRLALSMQAEDAAKNCVVPLPPGAAALSPAFAAVLTPVCAWPAPAAKAEGPLTALWLAVMGFAAPRSEFEAWRTYFTAPDSPYAAASAKDTVSAMLTAMLLNPNFLLEH